MRKIEYGHIALVEDDRVLSNLTTEYLTNEGYRVSQYLDGDSALDGITAQNPDCVLLDIMLPGKDGMEVCRQLRKNYEGPVIFLTAKSEPLDEILGLEVGGDDFLVKPVEPRRLLAHIRAKLRRFDAIEKTKPKSSVFQINHAIEKISCNGKSLPLSQPEYRLLVLLLESNQDVISRDKVMMTIRGVEHDGLSRTVDILVSDLRKKLPDPEWIKTVRGKGYVWQGAI